MTSNSNAFRKAMIHAIGEAPVIIKSNGRVSTFTTSDGRDVAYIFAEEVRYLSEDEEVTVSVGFMACLQGCGSFYEIEIGNAGGMYERINTLFDEYMADARAESSAWFAETIAKLPLHADGRHRVHDGATYLPVQSLSGVVTGMIMDFPVFRTVDRSDFDGSFVLLGTLDDSTETIILAHDWTDADTIALAGYTVLYVATFLNGGDLSDSLSKKFPQAKVYAIDDRSRKSCNRWCMSPDGCDPLFSHAGELDLFSDPPTTVVTLDQVLQGDFSAERYQLSRLGTPQLELDLMSGSVLAATAPEISYSIPEFIPDRSLVELHASPGKGKTTLLYQALAACANGKPFMGKPVLQRPCVVLNYENAAPAVKAMIERIDGADRILFLETPPQLDRPEWVKLKLMVQKLVNPLILVDTLASACVCSEIGSNGDFAPIMKRLIELRDLGATVVYLNHTLKQDASRFIGAQVIISQADHVCSLTTNTDGTYRLGTSGKSRYGFFEWHLDFNSESRMFELADDPDQQVVEEVKRLVGVQAGVNFQGVLDAVSVSEKRLRAILGLYDGVHWRSETGSRNARHYHPV